MPRTARSTEAVIDETDDYLNAYTYDDLGRATRITQSDAGGNPVAEKRVDYLYNDLGQRDTVTRWADLARTKRVAGTDHVFDQLGRLTSLEHERYGTTFAKYTFGWNDVGWLTDFNITSAVGDDGNADYDYDATGQLTDADYEYFTNQTDEEYTYDDNGNRTEANSDTYATGDHNRLLEDGTYRYDYDEEGNRTLRYVDVDESESLTTGDTEVTEYEWDHRNRLTSVADYDDYTDYTGEDPNWVVEYTYDAFNQLVGRTLDSDGDGDVDTTSAYVYQDSQIVLHYEDDSAGQLGDEDLAHRYLWGPTTDELLADEVVGLGDDETAGTADDVLWTLSDHQGSVRDWLAYDEEGTPSDPSDDSVSVEKHVTYDAFGNETSDTAPGVTSLFLFTGRMFDEDTGLQNNLHRWYDASVGRWVSVDPIGFNGDAGNLYRYCGNSPGNFIDPSGLGPVGPGYQPTGDPLLDQLAYETDEIVDAFFDKWDTPSDPWYPPTGSSPVYPPADSYPTPPVNLLPDDPWWVDWLRLYVPVPFPSPEKPPMQAIPFIPPDYPGPIEIPDGTLGIDLNDNLHLNVGFDKPSMWGVTIEWYPWPEEED